jgi:hypothetical protein
MYTTRSDAHVRPLHVSPGHPYKSIFAAGEPISAEPPGSTAGGQQFADEVYSHPQMQEYWRNHDGHWVYSVADLGRVTGWQQQRDGSNHLHRGGKVIVDQNGEVQSLYPD